MVLLPFASTSAHSVYPTYPPSSLFSSLSKNPPAISPPVADGTLAHPFTIPPEVYNRMLHVGWPITVSLIYITTVRYFNRVNKDRNYEPWPFSRSLIFYVLVVAHNIFLALYSGWTFAGMLNAVRRSWPGWNGEYGLAGVADALCKLHGPQGPGSAATYNTTTGSWGISDISMRLLGGMPDPTDVGRIWNEGLAFYGWLFYLSKFYEVVDTMIILVKGKKSSLLQTYHHAGAMFAMWSGIRFMSPPIWMFTFINSGLHTLMYTYYALCALTMRVPPVLKRMLTFLQIAQIIFGGSYALAHLFVAYDVPYYASYRVMGNLSTAIPSAISTASSAIVSATASANIGSWLKKAALRAAGEEGLAENVRNRQGETFGIDAIHAADLQKAQEQVSYKMEMRKTHCLDTSGEVLAILLNVLFLAPLAYLFISFFARYFQARANREPKPPVSENTRKSANDGIKEVERKIAEAMEDAQGGETKPPPELKAELEEAKDWAKKAADDAQQKSNDISAKVQNDLKELRARAHQGASDAKDKITESAPQIQAKVQEQAKDLSSKARDVAQTANDYVKDKAQATKDIAFEKAGEAKDNIGDSAPEILAKAQQQAKNLSSKVKDSASEVQGKAEQQAGDFSSKVEESAPKVQAKTEQQAGDFSSKVEESAPKVQAKAEQQAEDFSSKIKDSAPEVKAKAEVQAKDLSSKAKDIAHNTHNYANDTAHATKETANQKAAEAKDHAPQAADSAANNAKEATNHVAAHPEGSAGDAEAQKHDDNAEGAKNDHDEAESLENRIEKENDYEKVEGANYGDRNNKDGEAENMEDGLQMDHDDEKVESKEDGDDSIQEGDDLGDSTAYEVIPDMPKTAEEEKAEKDMQPNGK
ncbi:MAG: hypothetical protein Q9163_000169 [Psora crenata]